MTLRMQTRTGDQGSCHNGTCVKGVIDGRTIHCVLRYIREQRHGHALCQALRSTGEEHRAKVVVLDCHVGGRWRDSVA